MSSKFLTFFFSNSADVIACTLIAISWTLCSFLDAVTITSSTLSACAFKLLAFETPIPRDRAPSHDIAKLLSLKTSLKADVKGSTFFSKSGFNWTLDINISPIFKCVSLIIIPL